MRSAFPDGNYSLPVQVQVVRGVINPMFNDNGIRPYAKFIAVSCHDARCVALRLRPVCGIVGVLACGVGETDGYASTAIFQ